MATYFYEFKKKLQIFCINYSTITNKEYNSLKKQILIKYAKLLFLTYINSCCICFVRRLKC